MKQELKEVKADIKEIKSEVRYIWDDIKLIDNRLSDQEQETFVLKRMVK